MAEDIISDINDRTSRENNVIVSNMPDCVNANYTDMENFVKILEDCSEDRTLNINDIKLSGLGNKFLKYISRPLKVALPSNEHAHWFHQQNCTSERLKKIQKIQYISLVT